ncbi:Mor transcription activator family protein [Gallaecimonas xiamenensis]|uniref:Mu-like phage C protein, positive regulator of late transcription n=1 Tax=Gallaecimonas xiamenensis 3-C-1 TaxID=745411 RepID=K2KD73_9GAMM|nr:Mor transcription activator family protein [Gallaecimonas xiamenensis]EKE75205.1 Mu-like phage C protein, positive regulator of late transcription [Gallaecimonas xiamenensis 3-C-1]
MAEQQLDMMGTDLDQILAHLDQLSDSDVKKLWPQTLVNLVEVFEAAFKREGLSEDDAKGLAKVAVVSQAHYMGGRTFYLPRDERLKKALRNIRIWQEFTGRNKHELLEKYQLTMSQLVNIINEQKALQTAKVQMQLL